MELARELEEIEKCAKPWNTKQEGISRTGVQGAVFGIEGN